MSTPQKKTQEKGGCQCCAYVLGGDTAHSALHCGYEYFQQPAKDRKVVKLSSFPAVAAEHSCLNWMPKSGAVFIGHV
jgi:hypothetical protein